MGEIVDDANGQFFELPGIQDEIENFNRQLDASHDHLDHIVITGPTGVGKSQFVRIVKERLWNYKAEDAEFKTVDCESIAKEELAGWKSLDANGNGLIILENLECFPVEELKSLSALLKRVRVVATTRDELPGELIDYFKIRVEVPPLYKRRDDIFYFIVAKYPELYLTNFDLVRLYAYNWPGNLRELDRVLGYLLGHLHTEDKFPPDIERKIPEEKLYGLFRTMYDNGLQETELSLTHDICFPHIVPKADHCYLELKFENNDSSCDIEMRLLGLPNTTLNFKKIQWIFRIFFCLIYGRGVYKQNQNIFDLEPFSKEALELIEEAQEDVEGWLGGDARSEVENYNRHSILHFSDSLKQREIDAVRAYLKACSSACHANTFKHHNEEPALNTLKKATKEGVLSFFTITEAASKLAESETNLLRLATEGKIDLFFRFSVEKVETGQLTLSPAGENSIEWPAGKITPYAHPLAPEAEMHLRCNPDLFEGSSYEYPDCIPLLLLPRHAQAKLNKQELFVKYGWLPNGTAFNVIEPPEGVRVTSAGLLVAQNSLDKFTRDDTRVERAQAERNQEKDYYARRSNFLAFTDFVKQLEPYGKTEHEIFSLAVDGELAIYAPVAAVTVCWYVVIIGTDYRDPGGQIEYKKTTWLPLTRECIQAIEISDDKVKLNFDCPPSLRHFPLTEKEQYLSEVLPLGGWLNTKDLQFIQGEWDKGENVRQCSEGDRTQLYVRKIDAKRLESQFNKKAPEAVPLSIMQGQRIATDGLQSIPKNSKQKARKKSGRKASHFREVIEYLYDKFTAEGKTSFLQAGAVNEFIGKLKEIRNSGKDEFVFSRIKEVKKSAGRWRITTEEKIIKTTKSREISEKSLSYDSGDVSKILSIIRKRKALIP
ncbi:MAG: hypothetical protein V2B20_19005 [Pseudomonadota bacterium]